MSDTYTLTANFVANTGNFKSQVESAGRSVDNFEQKTNKTSGSTGQFGQKVAAGMKVAGVATTAVGITALKSFGQFEQSLNSAAIIAGGTSKDIDGLSKVALKMGQDLPLSAQDASDAMQEMARNGASVGEIKKVFPAVAKASTAAGADLKTTTEIGRAHV